METKHGSIQHMDDVFRRLAFANNVDREPVKSAMTALGLVLYYLNNKYEGKLIDGIYAAETLSGSEWGSAKYPRSNQFQAVLQRMFGANIKQMQLWGGQFADRFNKAWQTQYWVGNTFVNCDFAGLDKDKLWQLVVAESARSRPLMVIMRTVSLGGKTLHFYALAVCGYRTSFTGARELMAHPGLYGEEFIKGSRVQPIYVPLSQVVCAYSFNVLVKGNFAVTI